MRTSNPMVKTATWLIATTFYVQQNAFAAEAPVSPISAQEAISHLEEGNKRFARGASWHPKHDRKTAGILISAEHPHTIVLACSDSRVPPEVIFDQGLGDLFVVRTLGGVLDTAALASIEYAISKLNVQLILVLGHESCSSVSIAQSDSPAGSPSLDKIKRVVQSHLPKTAPDGEDFRLAAPVKAHVNGVSADLINGSEVVRKALDSKKLSIVQGLYSLQSSEVVIWRDGRAPAHSH